MKDKRKPFHHKTNPNPKGKDELQNCNMFDEIHWYWVLSLKCKCCLNAALLSKNRTITYTVTRRLILCRVATTKMGIPEMQKCGNICVIYVFPRLLENCTYIWEIKILKANMCNPIWFRFHDHFFIASFMRKTTKKTRDTNKHKC